MYKPHKDLTPIGQSRRYTQLAKKALKNYDLTPKKLTPIFIGENATYRLTTTQNQTYLLRIHLRDPSYTPKITSELTWLHALRQDSNLDVPNPIPRKDNHLVGTVTHNDLTFACSLMAWMTGRFTSSLTPTKAQALGDLLGQLHRHAATWKRPPNFNRGAWDESGTFGEDAGLETSVQDAWNQVPDQYKPNIEQGIQAHRKVENALGKGSGSWGLIHADLHQGNVLFQNQTAKAIDFDDSRDGLWIHDFAIILSEYSHQPGDYTHLPSLLKTYNQYHFLDPDQFQYIPDIVIARQASLMFWLASKSLTNQEFATSLTEWLSSLVAKQSRWQSVNPPRV